MFANSSVDVVTAIAVGGRGWAGGGTGVPVISGVDLVVAVGGRACVDVDLDVTAELVLMSTSTSPLSDGELVLMSTSTSPLSEGEPWWC